MVVDQFNVESIGRFEAKNDSPICPHRNRPKPFPCAFERVKAIPGNIESLRRSGRIKRREDSFHLVQQVGPDSAVVVVLMKPFESVPCHLSCITGLHHLSGRLLQPRDFRHDRGGFFFERGAHRLIVRIGNLAGFVFEIQVAQVFVDGFLALAEIAETRFFFSGVDFAGKKKT